MLWQRAGEKGTDSCDSVDAPGLGVQLNMEALRLWLDLGSCKNRWWCVSLGQNPKGVANLWVLASSVGNISKMRVSSRAFHAVISLLPSHSLSMHLPIILLPFLLTCFVYSSASAKSPFPWSHVFPISLLHSHLATLSCHSRVMGGFFSWPL